MNTKYGFSSRQTFGLDVLAITPNSQRQEFLDIAAEGSELHRKYGVYLDLVTVIQAYPENYDQRLTELFPRQVKKKRDAGDIAASNFPQCDFGGSFGQIHFTRTDCLMTVVSSEGPSGSQKARRHGNRSLGDQAAIPA